MGPCLLQVIEISVIISLKIDAKFETSLNMGEYLQQGACIVM